MPRPNKIWHWKARNEWCVKINKVRHRLGPDKAEAERRFHELMAKPEPKLPSNAVAYIIDLFLDWTQKKREPSTYRWYKDHLQSFLDSLKPKTLSVAQLKPHHVHTWVDSHNWGNTVRRGAMTAVARVFNWAEKMGHIDQNPIRKLEKPQAEKREQVVSDSEYKEILSNVNSHFHDLLVTTWETGCRPQEITRVEARHVDLENNRWIFPVNESKGKNRERVIYLTNKAAAITKRLMLTHPTGPLFRNRTGAQWTPFAISCTFKRLEPKLGKRYCLYAFRHSYCTHGLKKGVDPVTMANLMGHKDLTMIHRVYSHINQDIAYMRKSALRAAK